MSYSRGFLKFFIAFTLISCGYEKSSSRQKMIFTPEQDFTIIEEDSELYQSVGRISSASLEATGFFITKNLLLTNYHVAQYCSLESCSLKLNERHPLKLLSSRLYPDLALLEVGPEIEASEVKPLTLASSIETKSEISIVQFDSTTDESLKINLVETKGFILEENKDLYWNDLSYKLNTKAGSSGSPVLNSKGQVIAIHKGFDSKKEVNLATTLPSVNLFVTGHFLQEFEYLLTIYEATHDPRIKFDLAQILREVIYKNHVEKELLIQAYCLSPMQKDLEFYFKKIRKLMIQCPIASGHNSANL